MATNPILASSKNTDLTLLPAEMATFQPKSNDSATFSEYHDTSVVYSKLNVFVARAVYEYAHGVNGKPCELALIRVGDGWYAVEHKQANDTLIFQLRAQGKCSGCLLPLSSGLPTPLPTFGNKTGTAGAELDVTAIALCILMQLCDISTNVKARLQAVVDNIASGGGFAEADIMYLSDAYNGALSNGSVKVKLSGGNTDLLTNQYIQQGTLNGTVICGVSEILCGSKTAVAAKRTTFAEAKKEFQTWADGMHWSPEEQQLIPKFPDDYPVMPETMKLCSRYINTHGNRRPMVNFMWRGITSYGKSTGVSMMAALLNMPLLHMTCNSNMETQEFLSNIVPVGDDDRESMSAGNPISFEDLPSFADIACDPGGCYGELSGASKADATADDCMRAYADKIYAAAHDAVVKEAGLDEKSYADSVTELITKYAEDKDGLKAALLKLEEKRELKYALEAARGGKSEKRLFKQVESNFVKALKKGYIVEVQEISRIKDSGVLVGLNEYDRPGSIIPLVDGGSVTRHPDAIVVYTDNVGYSSCRPIDPSVIRRMSFIIDSYEMSKEDALARVVYNTGFADDSLLDIMYEVWAEVQKYCTEKDITEGSVSLTELEMWAQTVMADGYGNVYENCIDCLISKATSVPSEQREILSSVVALKLN